MGISNVNLGQGEDELKEVEEKALAGGMTKAQ